VDRQRPLPLVLRRRALESATRAIDPNQRFSVTPPIDWYGHTSYRPPCLSQRLIAGRGRTSGMFVKIQSSAMESSPVLSGSAAGRPQNVLEGQGRHLLSKGDVRTTRKHQVIFSSETSQLVSSLPLLLSCQLPRSITHPAVPVDRPNLGPGQPRHCQSARQLRPRRRMVQAGRSKRVRPPSSSHIPR
jgi:hypothetical protein